MILFSEALKRLNENLSVLGVESIPVLEATGRVVAETIRSGIDCPWGDVSLKDGYALRSRDVTGVTESEPGSFKIAGEIKAGGQSLIEPGMNETVRINTGGRLPNCCDSVIAEEDVTRHHDEIGVSYSFDSGFNVLKKGSDITKGTEVASKGQILTPQDIGLLTGSGHVQIPVIRKPKVHLISTGSELVVPGESLTPGSLYPSNLSTQIAWFRHLNIPVKMTILKDSLSDLTNTILSAKSDSDVIIVSGGAWKSDRDFTSSALKEIGWDKSFHRLKLGPGKAAGFGKIDNSAIFILPGGPPSNLVAFLKIVLPGVRILSGITYDFCRRISAVLKEDITHRTAGWTQINFMTISQCRGKLETRICKHPQRLKNLAQAHGILTLPEDSPYLAAGHLVDVDLINPSLPY